MPYDLSGVNFGGNHNGRDVKLCYVCAAAKTTLTDSQGTPVCPRCMENRLGVDPKKRKEEQEKEAKAKTETEEPKEEAPKEKDEGALKTRTEVDPETAKEIHDAGADAGFIDFFDVDDDTWPGFGGITGS